MNAFYWITAAVVTLAGVGIMGAGAGVHAKENADPLPEETTQFEEITALRVDLSHARFTCTADKNTKDVSVTVRNAKKSLEINDESGTLTIKDERRGFRFFDFGSWFNEPLTEVEVTIPQGQVFTLTEIGLGSGDGSEIKGLQTETLELDMASGSLAARDVDVLKSCTVNLASGTMSVNDFTVAGDLTGHMGSGELRLDSGTVSAMTMECASGLQVYDHMEVLGALRIETASGTLQSTDLTAGGMTRLDLASGDVNMMNFTPGNETMVKFASGDLDISLTGAQEDYTFDCSNTSGSTTIGKQSGKQLTVQGGEKRFTSEGASGDLNVQFVK